MNLLIFISQSVWQQCSFDSFAIFSNFVSPIFIFRLNDALPYTSRGSSRVPLCIVWIKFLFSLYESQQKRKFSKSGNWVAVISFMRLIAYCRDGYNIVRWIEELTSKKIHSKLKWSIPFYSVFHNEILT